MSKVEWKFLNDMCCIYDGTHQTPKYTNAGVKFVSVENINAPYKSSKYISEDDYSQNYKTKPQKGDVLMTRIGDVGTCAVLDNDEPLAYYVSLALLRPNSQLILSNYVKYILESNIGKRELRKKTLLTAVPLKINLGDVGKIKLPVPSLSEQNRIVGILDTFTSSIENLKEQIAQRRKQYEYYRDQLLDLEGKDGVEMKKLGEVCKIERGVRVVKKDLQEKGVIPVYQNSLIPLGYFDKSNYPENTTFVICAGAAGEIGYSKVDFWAADDCTCIVCPTSICSRYIYYHLMVKQHSLKTQVRKASVPRLSKDVIAKQHVFIPSLQEQQRIVDILDTFEASIQNLEAQLAQREKQYEYYRNKLLTFE